MKRDQVVGVAAAIVAAVSAALPWIKNVAVLYEANGKSALGAFDVPITFLISGPSKTPGGSIPAVAVAIAVVSLGLIVWTFLPRTPRRVLYIVWGLLAMAAPILLYMQVQKDIEAKGLTEAVFGHYGIGPFFLVGGGLIAIVAGIIGAGKDAAAETAPAPSGVYATAPQSEAQYAQTGYAQAPYGQPQYGAGPQAQPASPYSEGAQQWTPAPDPYAQAPQQPGAQPQAQDWGVPPQAPPTWEQPAQPQQQGYPQASWQQDAPATEAWDLGDGPAAPHPGGPPQPPQAP